jgi:hypothetical protein
MFQFSSIATKKKEEQQQQQQPKKSLKFSLIFRFHIT